ncbi:MAG: asparagine synthase (glutamine-hydrolyzing), partial [Thermoanaerobaculia bacterium]|nr:asparagine synthase (glutamine-hydrolyzing) [Thermoanaerobaculia bacterium]
MCGIVACYAYSPEVPPPGPEAVLRARDAMTPRGPDGAGLWSDPSCRVVLGHRRLAILDTSDRGAQPMVTDDGTTAITFNGEIYNFRALKEELEREGHRFRTWTDTEVVLALYRRHGAAFVDRLRGMFAFVLWDGTARTLGAARDPYGIKPLYVADDGRTIRLASQVKALVAGGGIDTSPEPAGHAGFFLWGSVPEPFTLFRGIRALAPGTVLVACDGEVRVERRLTVAALLSAKARDGGTDETGGLRDALLDSVRHHLVSDVPVGLFLSAGLDSRALAHLARDAGGAVEAVTLGFSEHEGTPRDEVPLAASVATALGLRHRVVRVTRSEFVEDLPHIFDAMDQPSIDGVNTWFVSKAARGLKVALSGLGGDELFGGYPSFRSIPRAVRAARPLSAVPGLGKGLRAVSAPLLRHAASPKWASLVEYGGSWGGAYLLRRGLFLPWELPRVLDADLAKEGLARLATTARLEESLAGIE